MFQKLIGVKINPRLSINLPLLVSFSILSNFFSNFTGFFTKVLLFVFSIPIESKSLNNFKKVSFPLLKELYLSNNKIDNIDALADLKIPQLRILWLANNNIVSIDILEKVKFPQLLKLSLSKNNIKDINVFTKNKAKFPQLYELYLNDNEFEMRDFSKILDNLFLRIKQFYY